MNKLKKPELLAPAGNIEALKAAVSAGADAVYFGCSSFNARAFAGNFEGETLKEAFRYCRLFGVKTNITLNTLLSDGEISKVIALVDELEKNYKPDAYIVQDIGLIKVLKGVYPQIPIHASTQMQIHSRTAASSLKDMGVSRIVFARELSRENIKTVAECGIETEIFAHGAICVCASGGCLMSSAIGGRSGNRGECAQPCRQSYNGGYPLSLKDMCLADHIPEICEMGVDCIKIEGRMKSPEYVYEVTSVYRRLLDECRSPTDDEKIRLLNAFSRSGFTDGYYTGVKGPVMFGIRSETDKEKSRALNVNIMPRKLDASIKCAIKNGVSSMVCASCSGLSVTVEGAVPGFANNRPLDEESVKARLEKSGGTVFNVIASVDLDDGLIMPVSAINALRRDALSKLEELIIENNTPKRDNAQGYLPKILPGHSDKKSNAVARFEGKVPDADVLNFAFEVCDRVDLPLWCEIPQGFDVSRISLVLPRIIYDNETDKIKAMISRAYDAGVRQLTVPNISFLPLCEGFIIHGDYPLNLTNSYSASVFEALGFEDVCVSPEQRASAVKTTLSLAYLVYGRMPLMHTDNCIIKNCKACKKTSFCASELKDKTGACFPIMREYSHRNTIYNSVPTYLLDKQNLFDGVSCVLMFTTETKGEIIDILRAFENNAAPVSEFTRAAYKKKGGVFNE